MKKLILNVILMLFAVNAAIFLGSCAAGKPFAFSLIFNLFTPIVCALTCWEGENRRRNP